MATSERPVPTDRAFIKLPNTSQIAAIDLESRRVIGRWANARP